MKQLSDILEANVDSSLSYSITNNEIDSLTQWAQLCPEYYGAVVHRSRALLRLMNPDYIEPSVACASIAGGMKRKSEGASNTDGPTNRTVLIYPNPSEGNAFVHLRSSETNAVAFFVFNTLGMKIYEGIIAPNSEVELPSKNWPKGVYILRIEGQSDSGLRFIRR